MGTAWPLDPPLDRQGGTGPGAGARCRRPSEVKGGCSRRMRRIPAPQVPSRHPRGKWVGPRGTPLLGLRSSGQTGIHWEGGPSCAAAPRRLHTLKSHDAGTSQATTQLYPGVFQHPTLRIHCDRCSDSLAPTLQLYSHCYNMCYSESIL